MAKCDYYYQHGMKFLCYGTKEMEECSCGGDTSKCNFYPEKRKQKVQKMANEKPLGQILSPYEQGEWDMFNLITSVNYGKQYYFLQSNGMVYSRESHKYMTREEAYEEYLKGWEY